MPEPVEPRPCPPEVQALVEKFEKDRDRLFAPGYKEANVRQEFLDPFFRALGWDPQNTREVLHEYSLSIKKSAKSVDYSFFVQGKLKFFVEAKKPSVDLGVDPKPARQLRTYGWNAGLPLSILSDFEELIVYDTSIRPKENDTPIVARRRRFHYTEYVGQWTTIWNLFSKEAVRSGALEAYSAATKGKKDTLKVDASFLEDISGWRIALAKSLVAHNKLSVDELSGAVQTLIDRIIFLRICEDRGLELEGRLKRLLDVSDLYSQLKELFRLADGKYNSGLFHFEETKGRPGEPDNLSQRLVVEDKVLKEVIKGLYDPNKPYDFSIMPPEILGQVYEQFLGQVIRITESGERAKVEDKPEVKKAGGVYYTPTYIVDHVVKNTIGKLLENKTPKEAAELRIVDPACGSGSFLIGAYQFLLNWHRDWYEADGVKKNKKILVDAGNGRWVLGVEERKRILLNNIFGVDIDVQAVEVTKLSLLLKVLENASGEELSPNQKLFQQRALPDLDSNIKCGNSLIGTDFHAQTILFGKDERREINAFDWEIGFKDIMRSGGFDAVIGNPPYLNVDDTWGKGDSRLLYLKKKYGHIYRDKTDLYYYFLARGLTLTKGVLGFIVSRAFLEAYKADLLRGWLAKNGAVASIVDFQNKPIFLGVGITTAIVTLTKARESDGAAFFTLTGDLEPGIELETQLDDAARFKVLHIEPSKFGTPPWLFAEASASRLLSKIDAVGKPVAEILHIGKGMETGCNDAFGKLEKSSIEEWKLKKAQYFVRARNSDIQRFVIEESGEYLLYLEEVSAFSDLPNGVQKHLESFSAELKGRAAYERGNCDWWRYTWPLHKAYLGRKRIFSPYMAKRNRFALDNDGKYLSLTDTTVLYENGQTEDLRYLLGLLNSKLLTFRFRFLTKLKSGGIYEYFWNQIGKLPIRTINFNDPADKKRHDAMVQLVERMLDLHKRLGAAIGRDRELLEREIASVDAQIDDLVYELYRITDEERKIVEEATAR